jgi:hypothetical protein
MAIIQWIVAAGTAVFVALIAYLQLRTAQQRAALDLFDRRYELFCVFREAVAQMTRSSAGFDQQRERDFIQAKERAYFSLAMTWKPTSKNCGVTSTGFVQLTMNWTASATKRHAGNRLKRGKRHLSASRSFIRQGGRYSVAT